MSFNLSNKVCEFVKNAIFKAQGVRAGSLFKMLIRIKHPKGPSFCVASVLSKGQNLAWKVWISK